VAGLGPNIERGRFTSGVAKPLIGGALSSVRDRGSLGISGNVAPVSVLMSASVH
jgi:hypothetical protein